MADTPPDKRKDWKHKAQLIAPIAVSVGILGGTIAKLGITGKQYFEHGRPFGHTVIPPASREYDPFGERLDISPDLQVSFSTDRNGRPVMLNWWPEGTPSDQRVLRVNIASALPKVMAPGTPLDKHFSRDLKESPNDETHLADAFSPIDGQAAEWIHEYFQKFEKTYGIKVTVTHDAQDADLHIVGAFLPMKPREHINAIATFPKGMAGSNSPMAFNPGGIVFSYDFIRDTVFTEHKSDFLTTLDHEVGHAIFGARHLYNPMRSNQEMYYSIHSAESRADLMTSVTGHPSFEFNFVSAGEELATGPLQLYARKVLGVTSPLNAGNTTYHADALHQRSKDANAHHPSTSLPAIGIADTGGTNIFIGTAGNDYIDMNPSMVSTLHKGEQGTKRVFGIERFSHEANREQLMVLVDGALHRVMTREGNDVIIAAKEQQQMIEPGSGTNQVQVFHPKSGQITIRSEGKDTLTLSQEMFHGHKVQAQQEGKSNILLHFDHSPTNQNPAFIRLLGQSEGKGISALRVVNRQGTVLAQYDTRQPATAEQWQQALNAISHVCNTNQLAAPRGMQR